MYANNYIFNKIMHYLNIFHNNCLQVINPLRIQPAGRLVVWQGKVVKK